MAAQDAIVKEHAALVPQFSGRGDVLFVPAARAIALLWRGVGD